MAVQVVLVVVDKSWPDVRDDAAAETGMTSADDVGNKRLCGRTDSGLLDVFASKTSSLIITVLYWQLINAT